MIVITEKQRHSIPHLLQVSFFLDFKKMLQESFEATMDALLYKTLTDREQYVCIGELRILRELLKYTSNAHAADVDLPNPAVALNPLRVF